MSIIQDAKGRPIPSWARHTEVIAASGSLSGYKESGSTGIYIPFSIYLADESAITYTTVEDPSTEVTFTFGAGYHPIAFATIVSTAATALALFAYKPS